MTEEIRSLDWIGRNAREAAEQLNKHGIPPRNPCTPGSTAHKVWAKVFYECGLHKEKADTPMSA